MSAFAITVRLLVEGMLGVAADWQQMLVVLAVCSMALGNLVAITQTNLKRLLAYSSIAQMGFMLLGLCSGVIDDNAAPAVNAYSSAMFYVVTYVLTTLGTFGLIMLMSRAGFEAEEVSDLKGLAKRSPWFALVMAIFMLSLAGLPPTVGFYAKLGGAAGAGHHQRRRLHLARRRGRDPVGGRRVLLSARHQAHVLRRSGRCVAAREQRRGEGAVVAQRHRGAGALACCPAA